jgi:hypothetical protein
VAALLLVLLAARLFITRRAIGNYSDPNAPSFAGSYAGEGGNFDGSLRVVTWNLHHGENLEQAIETLEDGVELRGADILLFQEIDAKGVETIGRWKGNHRPYRLLDYTWMYLRRGESQTDRPMPLTTIQSG